MGEKGEREENEIGRGPEQDREGDSYRCSESMVLY